jgi:hypothetical protein
MPASLDLKELGLTLGDLDAERKRGEEQKEAAARKRRTFSFAGVNLDTAAGDARTTGRFPPASAPCPTFPPIS